MSHRLSVEERVQRLEDAEQIRNLKATYWQRCDLKDVDAVRACFCDGPIEIHYDGTGSHTHRDSLYEIFERLSMHEAVVEHHHGGAGQVHVHSATDATGRWSLSYQVMNTERGTIHKVGGYYEDAYRKVEGAWRIAKTRFRICSVLAGHRGEDGRYDLDLIRRNLPDAAKRAGSEQ